MTADLTRDWMLAAATSMRDHAEDLSALDAAIGDGDHGTNMRRGFDDVAARLDNTHPATIGEVLTLSGRALISTVGGASGPLYGSALRAAGRHLATPTATAADLLAGLRAGEEALRRLGGANTGDKTIVDALAPALEAYAAALQRQEDLPAAARAAAQAAAKGAQATTPLVARKGRASYLGQRSAGHQDPGATSAALLLEALWRVVGQPE